MEGVRVKIFRAEGGRVDCCAESDSSSRRSGFGDEDEDEDEERSFHIKVERARLSEDAWGGSDAAAPKMSSTSFLAAASTYFWK